MSDLFRFPPYVAPRGAPHYWQWETTGQLTHAIKAYLANRTDKTAISPADCDLVKAYLLHWINAPIWDELERWMDPADAESQKTLTRLRDAAARLTDADSIAQWIHAALDIGIDPL